MYIWVKDRKPTTPSTSTFGRNIDAKKQDERINKDNKNEQAMINSGTKKPQQEPNQQDIDKRNKQQKLEIESKLKNDQALRRRPRT